ncbi:polysaccharide deacetylase family protein [Candidatus Hydrogenedentota bacterium]
MISEFLGFGADQKLMLGHIDDVGVCHSANDASMKALHLGMAASGSLMMPCAWIPEAAQAFKDKPDLDLGVHATFTSERDLYRWRPLAPCDKVSTLVDSEGYFYRTTQEVVSHARAEEYEFELRAQIDHAYEMGFEPTHLDTHMGTCLWRPDFFEIYIGLAREYGIPPLLVRPDSLRLSVWTNEDIESWLLPRINVLEEEGFILIDCLLNVFVHPTGEHKTVDERRKAYHGAIRRCVPGLNFLCLHMAHYDDEARAAMDERPARSRAFDHQVFMEEETRQVAQEANVRFIGWREIQMLFREKTKYVDR